MTNRRKVIFVQGHGMSSPTEVNDWPFQLGQALKKYDIDFIHLAMPNPMYPEVNEWVNFLNQQKFDVDLDTYFVGHSLGCITIARFLEKLPEKNIAGGCVMVSGFCSFPEVPVLQEFCTRPLDFSLVKKHSRDFVMVVSDNDRVIPPSFSEELASKLGAKVIVEHKKGHFVTGTKEIPSVLNSILEIGKIKKKVSIRNLFGF